MKERSGFQAASAESWIWLWIKVRTLANSAWRPATGSCRGGAIMAGYFARTWRRRLQVFSRSNPARAPMGAGGAGLWDRCVGRVSTEAARRLDAHCAAWGTGKRGWPVPREVPQRWRRKKARVPLAFCTRRRLLALGPSPMIRAGTGRLSNSAASSLSSEICGERASMAGRSGAAPVFRAW